MFEWKCFLSMVTIGEWGKVKKRYLDMVDAKKKK